MNAPAFQLYPKDIIASPAVLLMTPEAKGGYLMLFCWAWDPPQDGKLVPPGHLPDDNALLAQLSGLGAEGWARCSASILRAFTRADGLLRLEWLAGYHQQLEQFRTKQSEAGKRGNEKKWADHNAKKAGSGADRDPIATRSQTDRSSTASSSASASSSPTATTTATTPSEETLAADAAPQPSAAGPAGVKAGQGSRVRGKQATKDPEPLPFSIATALETIAAHSKGAIIVAPYDSDLSKPLTAAIRKHPDLADWKLLAEWAGAGAFSWMTDAPGLKWLAATANVADAIGKARAWDAAGRPAAGRNGKAGKASVGWAQPAPHNETTKVVEDF